MKITGVSFIYSFHFYRATNYELLERWNRKQKPRWSSRERGLRFPRKELPRNRNPLQRYGCPRKFFSTRAHPRRRKYVERMSRLETTQQLFSLLFYQRISFANNSFKHYSKKQIYAIVNEFPGFIRSNSTRVSTHFRHTLYTEVSYWNKVYVISR